MNSKDWFKLAKDVASVGTCLKVRYGCILVNNGRCIGIGCNAPIGDVLCKKCSRLNTPHGEAYDESCRYLHSEEWAIVNTIQNGNSSELDGAEAFIYGIGKSVGRKPCFRCKRLLDALGIKKIHVKVEEGERN